MKPIDRITIKHGDYPDYIELLVGDLADIPPEHAVDILVISVFSNDYAWYLFVHHCAHHGPDKLPLPLLKHHQSHHGFATRNYGVSTKLWDHAFGTMLR
jgi:sterol desaturase/sphingolipid hydroxylase (fatty acid hydroxylase superfamily)